MSRSLILVVLLLALVASCYAKSYGVDVSVAQTTETFKCFLSPTYKGKLSRTIPLASSPNNGPIYTADKQKQVAATAFTHVIVRTPLLSGANVGATIKAAAAAGYTPNMLGVYFINFNSKVGPAAGVPAIRKVAADLKAAGVTTLIGELWLDVETQPGWSKSQTTNCQYLTAIVKEIKANPTVYPWKLGMYTGMYTWATIVGKTCDFTPFKDLPLWYAAYGKGYDDFSSFKPMPNAWQSAAVHQWHGTTSFCGTNVDFNVYAT